MTWLKQPLRTLVGAHSRGQLPHALLLHGAAGTGRRMLAGQLAAQLLHVDQRPGSAEAAREPRIVPESLQVHPDFIDVQPLPEKKSIAIDQVRALIDFLGLTSHQKGAKIAVIAPADLLSRAAANALLKTLEEPPGNSVLMLITDAVSRLPATVVSRCHRVRVPKPSRAAGLDWLKAQDDRVDWRPLLAQTGGAPLAALALQHEAGDQQLQAFIQDLDDLVAARVTPAAVARNWQKLNADICFSWLYRRVAAEIKRELAGEESHLLPKSRRGGLQNGDKMLNMHRSFEALGELCELRRLKVAGINTELHLANVLSRWYGA